MTQACQAALAELLEKRQHIDAAIAGLQALESEEVPTARPDRRPRRSSSSPAAAASPEPSKRLNPRAEAILAFLVRNDRIGTAKEIRQVLDKLLPQLTDQQRSAAFRNEMHRLKVKGLVTRTGHTWGLVVN